MYSIEYDSKNRNWKLHGVADGRVSLTFDQGLVRCLAFPARHRTVSVCALHGLTIPAEVEPLISQGEMLTLTGSRRAAHVGAWQLLPDGKIERSQVS